MLRSKSKIAFALSLIVLMLGGFFFWKTTSTAGVTNNEEFNQKVRNALTETNITTVSNIAAANAVSNSLADFISYRSGVQISSANKSFLAQNELKSSEQSKKISQGVLAQILTDVSFEKLVTLSDSDISSMSDTLRGFTDAGLAPVFNDGRRFVRLRANGEGTMDPTYFVNQLKSARDSEIRYKTLGKRASESDVYIAKMSRTAMLNRITGEIADRTSYISKAQPNFFNGSATNDMTPTQAMLITYSVVTNDLLTGNQIELTQKMSDFQSYFSQSWGQQYPSPQNQRAYGANGYIYSTPANILLDDTATSRVLTLIKESSNLQ